MSEASGYDVDAIRADFPILSRDMRGAALVYLDNAASAQKPQPVIDAVAKAYGETYANVHRGLHHLSMMSTDAYEETRGAMRRFLGAAEESEIIFTSGATMGLNLVASSWAAPRIAAGDEIILTVMDHHANIVPWHFLRERRGAKLVWIAPDAEGDIAPEAFEAAITPRTKLIAAPHMSNVLGTVLDIKRIAEIATAHGVPIVVDGAQAAAHMPVDMRDLGVDFYVVTGHKLYGPTGSGALYARASRQDEMRPFLGGGAMIKEVTLDHVSYSDPPAKFEAGTPGIAETIGLGAAIRYLETLGMERVAAHERDLRDYAAARLSELNYLTLHGAAADKGAIFSFAMAGAHPHDVATVVDRRGVAVRAGHHCCQPLMRQLGVAATTRASFGLYNTRAEADALAESLERAHGLFA